VDLGVAATTVLIRLVIGDVLVHHVRLRALVAAPVAHPRLHPLDRLGWHFGTGGVVFAAAPNAMKLTIDEIGHSFRLGSRTCQAAVVFGAALDGAGFDTVRAVGQAVGGDPR